MSRDHGNFVEGACVAAVLCAVTAALAQSAPEDLQGLHARITASQRQAVAFLRSQIGKDGRCLGEYPKGQPEFGGKTALCVYSLLAAGADWRQSDMQAALKWLLEAKLGGTYAVALRACALAAVKDERATKALAADVDWLIKAAYSNGAYTYTSQGGGPCQKFDNSNSQMAVLGVWAGAQRGLNIPPQYWQVVERYWQEQQQSGGGWGYFTHSDGRAKTYGSMTAAGLATLFVCFDNLHRDEFVRCTATSDPKPIADGLKWLAENYRPDENPKIGDNHYGYWLFSLERAGLASGYKYFGGHDWYGQCVRELLLRQNAEGSWDYGPERAAQTSLALLFLVRGRDPLVMSKLRYGGKWNARPRDLANFTRGLGETFERSFRWQVVDLEAASEDWHDAPILYVSGAGAVEFTPEQVARLRKFVLEGGGILSESACNSADFTLDIQRLYKRMFPSLELARLADDHPIYSVQVACKDRPGLMGLSNGVRMLAVHCPREISLALQLGASPTNQPTFDLATNIFYYLTDKGQLPPPGSPPWPASQPFEPAATIRLARLKYNGNYDPEPLAWQRLAVIMGNRHRIRLLLDEPIDPAQLDAKVYPVAAMTGTAAFTLTDAQAQGLKKYLAAGGRLVIEAAGGSAAFADSARREVLALYPKAKAATLVSGHDIYHHPEAIDKITFRAEYAATLGQARSDVRLQAVVDGPRVVMVFSPEDLTAGMLGAAVYRLKGYAPETAVSLMTNILCNLADVKP